MSKYYSIVQGTNIDGDMMIIEYDEDDRARDWLDATPFDLDSSHPGLAPPPEPIEILVEDKYKNAPLPEFVETPIPLISPKLLKVLQIAGVDNIDTYKTELRDEDGNLVSDELLAFNLIGKVAAADLEKSEFDASQPDRKISMSFDSLSVDSEKANGLLMFRLAENISTILIEESLKKAIEEADIGLLKIYETENIAIL